MISVKLKTHAVNRACTALIRRVNVRHRHQCHRARLRCKKLAVRRQNAGCIRGDIPVRVNLICLVKVLTQITIHAGIAVEHRQFLITSHLNGGANRHD